MINDNQVVFIENLLLWHKLNKRDFFWRHNISPYRIMIAEFMLQRTRAEQVEPVYKKFLQQYPDVITLSKAKYKSVAKYTDKLGIHWRAKHFIDAAKYIVKELNCKIPDNRNDLLKIPGIGDYVAGAILTVCYNKTEFVIDSNIARFINRYYGLNLNGEIRRKKEIILKSKKIFNFSYTRKLLFALLDFTAIICKPNNPECSICIFLNYCKYEKK